MSTPRTDAALQAVIDGDCLPGCDSQGHETLCPYFNPEMALAVEMRVLERELAAVTAERDALRQKLSELAEAGTGYSQQTVDALSAELTRLRAYAEADARCPCCEEIETCKAGCTFEQDSADGWERMRSAREALK